MIPSKEFKNKVSLHEAGHFLCAFVFSRLNTDFPAPLSYSFRFDDTNEPGVVTLIPSCIHVETIKEKDEVKNLVRMNPLLIVQFIAYHLSGCATHEAIYGCVDPLFDIFDQFNNAAPNFRNGDVYISDFSKCYKILGAINLNNNYSTYTEIPLLYNCMVDFFRKRKVKLILLLLRDKMVSEAQNSDRKNIIRSFLDENWPKIKIEAKCFNRLLISKIHLVRKSE